MAKYTGLNFKLTWNAVDITSMVVGAITFSRDGVVEDTTPYGVADQQQTYAGMNKMPDITIEALYDDTVTTGSDAVFNNVGVSHPLVYTWGGTKTSTLSGIIKSYQRIGGVGKVLRIKAVIAQVGPVTEA
jgi:hypothetical protein